MGLNSIGSFGEALMRAFGRAAVGRGMRLHAEADSALMRHGVSREAVAILRTSVDAEPALMIELLDEIKFTDGLLRTFLLRRAAALKASGVVVPAGRHADDAQSVYARGNSTTEHQNPAGHSFRDAQHAGARGTPEHRAGQSKRGNPEVPARPVQNKPRGLARMRGATALMRNHILDRLIVNGQPLRSVTAGEALGAAEVMSGNAATIVRICTGLKPDVPVGRQLSDSEAEERAALS